MSSAEPVSASPSSCRSPTSALGVLGTVLCRASAPVAPRDDPWWTPRAAPERLAGSRRGRGGHPTRLGRPALRRRPVRRHEGCRPRAVRARQPSPPAARPDAPRGSPGVCPRTRGSCPTIGSWGGPLVASHDQLEQVLGRCVGQLAHAEVVDDEQGHAGQLGQVVLVGLGEGRLGELLEEGVGFAVDDAVALLDRGAADGLSQMTLARTGRADQQSVLALGDEAGGGELEDEGAVDLLVEGEVEAEQRLG